MSILLDALRKSEKHQQQPDAPSIHSQEPSGSFARQKNRDRLILLLVVVLLLGGWFVWQRFLATTDRYRPPVTLASNGVEVITSPVTTLATDGNIEPVDPTSKPLTGAAGNGQRTPVERYQEKLSGPDLPASNKTAKQKVKPGVSATKKPKKASTSQDQSRSKKSSNKTASQSASGKKNQAKTGTGKRASKPVKLDPKPAPISYWELPDAIREKVPEIKFSVLVYAKNPADRFVLIDGQRLKERDRFPPEIIVREIRRDGVVFRYKLYEFLVER